MVEGARLESVYTATYRGFESLLLRHLIKNASLVEVFLFQGRQMPRNVEDQRFTVVRNPLWVLPIFVEDTLTAELSIC